MDEFARGVAPLIPQNPKLELLEGYVAWDDCRTKREGKQYEEAHRACDLALRSGDSSLFLREKAYLLRLEERHSDRLPILDRALRMDPQDPKALKRRYFARMMTGDILGAARDFVLARHLTPADEQLAKLIENMVAALRYEGQELRKQGLHDEAAKYFTLGLQLAPDDMDLIHRQAWNQKLAGVEALVREIADHPDDFDLRLRLDYGLASSERFGEVVTLWDEFIARHPTDPRPYRERGGAKWHLRQHDAAIDDMQKACDLGMKTACRDAASMKSRG
jgi:tetratricopeptide (TPR) repeat protein